MPVFISFECDQCGKWITSRYSIPPLFDTYTDTSSKNTWYSNFEDGLEKGMKIERDLDDWIEDDAGDFFFCGEYCKNKWDEEHDHA